jgi:hypothetical protein
MLSFFMFEHDGIPRTAVSYSAGCEISKTPSFCACPSPKNTGLFLIYVRQLNLNIQTVLFTAGCIVFTVYFCTKL